MPSVPQLCLGTCVYVKCIVWVHKTKHVEYTMVNQSIKIFICYCELFSHEIFLYAVHLATVCELIITNPALFTT